MFETLEAPEELVARPWPLLLYGTYTLAGICFVILGVWRHGLSRPFNLKIAAIVLVLPLLWLVMTLRERSPVSSRSFVVRSNILLVLVTAHNILTI